MIFICYNIRDIEEIFGSLGDLMILFEQSEYLAFYQQSYIYKKPKL